MTREDREGPFEPGVAFTGSEAAVGRRNPMRMMRTAGRGRIRSMPSQCQEEAKRVFVAAFLGGEPGVLVAGERKEKNLGIK